jgi:hypothetical protein
MDVAMYITCPMVVPLDSASLLAAWIPPSPRSRKNVVPTNSSAAALQSNLNVLNITGVE